MLFDAHFHIIDPKFPLIENKGFIPDPFTIKDYQKKIDGLPFIGGALVAGSFQHGYQDFLIKALERLGEGFVGVTSFSTQMTDAQLITLNKKGVKAVRFNLFRGGNKI